MQIFKTTQQLFLKEAFLKSRFSTIANPFQTEVSKNRYKNSVRFENQDRIWTYEELETHSNAFAYGLVELGYKPGDKLVVWAEKQSNAEIVGAQLGAGKAGVTLVPTYANTQAELEAVLKSSNATGILYTPNSTVSGAEQNNKYNQIINQAIPELEQQGNLGRNLKSAKFPNLKYIVHTGFYTQPGQYKYRDTLVYASKNFNTLQLPKFNESAPFIIAGDKTYSVKDLKSKAEQLRKTHKITENQTIFVAGDARSPLSFALGILSSTLYGNYCVYTGNQPLSKLGKVVSLHNDSFLVLDSDVAQQAQNQLGWDQSALDSLKSVALLDQGKGDKISLDSLFSGKQNAVYGQAL